MKLTTLRYGLGNVHPGGPDVPPKRSFGAIFDSAAERNFFWAYTPPPPPPHPPYNTEDGSESKTTVYASLGCV